MNPNSFINKIYGIFSLNFNKNGKENGALHFALQKNITYIGGSYIRRTYDLKGSEYSREVLSKFKLKVIFFFYLNMIEKKI